MSRAYYDANYLFKLQCVEHGTAAVQAHAASVKILCIAAHGRAEFASAAFRKVREGTATPHDYKLALAQVKADAATGNLQFLPLTDAILDRPNPSSPPRHRRRARLHRDSLERLPPAAALFGAAVCDVIRSCKDQAKRRRE